MRWRTSPENPRLRGWLDAPVRPLIGFAGWVVALALFVGLIALVGGVVVGDAAVSIYSTWAVAHGQLACAYPPASHLMAIPSIARPWTTVTPFYPVFSGIVAALTGIGHGVPFPSSAQLGVNCVHGYVQMFRWSVLSGAAMPTLRIGYLSGVFLLGGVVAVLRASGRGRNRLEIVVLLVVASLASVLGTLVQYFHPQDLVAMGLILLGIAAVLRDRWWLAGLFLGLALVTQQFALLAAVALFVAVPTRGRWRLAFAAFLTAAVVDVPFLIATSGRALHAIVVGTGFSPSLGGTVLWETDLHGSLLFVASRVMPIVVAGLIAIWARRRLGDEVVTPPTLVSLVGTALAMRLVFEVNLWAYYFMALAVSLVVLEAVRGRLRPTVVGWLLASTLAFDPLPGVFQSNAQVGDIYARLDSAEVVVGVAALYVVISLVRKRVRWFWLGWVVFATLAFVHIAGADVLEQYIWRTWVWQVLLVPSGLALVAQPLVAVMRASRRTTAYAVDPVPEAPVAP